MLRRAKHGVSPAVGVHQHLTVVLPVIGTNIQHRHAVQLGIGDGNLVHLNGFVVTFLTGLFGGCVHLAPFIQVVGCRCLAFINFARINRVQDLLGLGRDGRGHVIMSCLILGKCRCADHKSYSKCCCEKLFCGFHFYLLSN